MSNTKINLVANLFIASVVLVGFSGSRCFAGLAEDLANYSTWTADTFSGYLTIDEINVNGTTIGASGLAGLDVLSGGTWDNTDTKLSYSVEAIYNGGIIDHFHYTYTFYETGQGTLSHISFEVSEAVPGGLGAFTVADISNATHGNYDVDDHSDSGMPSSPLYSIKWDETANDASSGTWTVEFDSMRVPEWGDFYAKNGAKAGYAYNTGFGLDPYSGSNLDLYGYIARPDTEYVPVPPAVLLGLLGMTVAGVKLRKFA